MNKKALFAILIGHMICTSAYGVPCPNLYAFDDNSNGSESHILQWEQNPKSTDGAICTWKPDSATANTLADCRYTNTNNLIMPNGNGCYGHHYETGSDQGIGSGAPGGHCVRNYKRCDPVNSFTDRNVTGHIFYDTQTQRWPSGMGTHCYVHQCDGTYYKYFYPDPILYTDTCGANTTSEPYKYGNCRTQSNLKKCSELDNIKSKCSNRFVDATPTSISVDGTYTFNRTSPTLGTYDYTKCTCTHPGASNEVYSGWDGNDWTRQVRACTDIDAINDSCTEYTQDENGNEYPNATCEITGGTIQKNLKTRETTHNCSATAENIPVNNGYYNIYLYGGTIDQEINQISSWTWGTTEYELQNCKPGYYVPDYNDENSNYYTNPDACKPVGRGYYSVEDDNFTRKPCPIGSTTDTDTSGASINDCHLTSETIFQDNNGKFSISGLTAPLAN